MCLSSGGKVVKIIDVGAFVQLPGGIDGFVHISELADYRIDFVDDVLTEGKSIKVKVIGFDKKGKLSKGTGYSQTLRL